MTKSEGMTALELAQQLKTKFGDLISEPTEFRGELTLRVFDAQRMVEVCAFAKGLGFCQRVFCPKDLSVK